jgi:hypothetical protein
LFNVNKTDSDLDIEKLIEKTENEGEQTEAPKESGMTFSFAKVWAADKDTLEDIEETAPENANQGDSWAQTLQRIELERQKEKEQEITGRGARRRATALFPQVRKAPSTTLPTCSCLCVSFQSRSKNSISMTHLTNGGGKKRGNPSPSPRTQTNQMLMQAVHLLVLMTKKRMILPSLPKRS